MQIDYSMPILGPLYKKWIDYRADFEKIAIQQFKLSGLHRSGRLDNPIDPFFGNLTGLAM